MIRERQMNKNLFSFSDFDMTEEEFNEAMYGLINKGLAVRTVIKNKDFFYLTSLGKTVRGHTYTDPSKRN